MGMADSLEVTPPGRLAGYSARLPLHRAAPLSFCENPLLSEPWVGELIPAFRNSV